MLTLLVASLAYQAAPSLISEAATPPPPEQIVTVPLYFLANTGAYFYTTDLNEMATLQGKKGWHYQGISCYVIPNSKKVPGSVGMYRLTKQASKWQPAPLANITYSKFFYTTDKSEADNAANNLGWRIEGIAFYVSPKPIAALNTVELYRLYLPDIENFEGDRHYYTVSKGDMNQTLKIAYWKFVRVEAYVWDTAITFDSSTGLSASNPPPAPKKADLVVSQTIADQTSVTALITNKGGVNTGGVKYEVSLLVYDKRNDLENRLVVPGPGLSPNQTMPVKFSVKGGGGRQYRVVIDEPNVVAESNETNNATQLKAWPPPKIKTGANSGEQLNIPLVAGLANKQDLTVSSGQFKAKNTIYSLKVSNASAIPKEWFQPLTVLDPVPCGVSTNARLLAEVRWRFNSEGASIWKSGSCKPLASPQDLAVLDFSVADNKIVPDKLMVVVFDRLTSVSHKSNSVPVGAFGVKEALYPLQCFAWLGRSDDIACKTPEGMAACENLRAKGKPINCRLVKKQQ
jgi:hypothetical protein